MPRERKETCKPLKSTEKDKFSRFPIQGETNSKQLITANSNLMRNLPTVLLSNKGG